MKKTAVALCSLALILPLSGCYKAEMEAQTKRAEAAEAKIKETEAAKAAAEARAAQAQQAVNMVNSWKNGGAQLATIVNGQTVGADSMRVMDNGQFVRHGPRRRQTWTVNYSNGVLADQAFAMNRDNGNKYVEGTIKNGKADGEWTWYSKDGKAANRETYKDGKLASVESASTAKDGKVTWKKMDKASSDKFFNDRLSVFAGIPELIREK